MAEGSSGIVLRASRDGRALAVKVGRDPGEDAARRALREARIVASIDDARIVRVEASGRLEDGRAWVAMEWIDGQTLEAFASAPLPAAAAARIGAEIARALATVHARGIVHRDLKPANVMVRPSGAIVVVDFGIARASGDAATSQSRLAGTPHYMAPEQALGDAIDARTDLYALGCVLYRLISGRVPFEGSALEVMLAHLGQPARPLECDARLAALVERLMTKRPAERPATARAIADELAAIAASDAPDAGDDDATVVTPMLAFDATLPVAVPRTRRRVAVRRTTGALLLTLAALAVGAGAFAGVRAIRAEGMRVGARAVGDHAHAGAGIGSGIGIGIGNGIGNGNGNGSGSGNGNGADAVSGAGGADAVSGADPSVIVVDGGWAMRATLPRAPRAGDPLAIDLSIWDSEGKPIAARQVAATIEDPRGVTVALGVPLAGPGTYRLRPRADLPGAYVVTVYAPSGETTFAVTVDVSAA